MKNKRMRKDEKREVTPELVNMSKEILYPQIQGVTFMHVPVPDICLSSESSVTSGQMDGNKARCDCSMFVVKPSLY